MTIDEERLDTRHARFLVQRLLRWVKDGSFGTQYQTPLAEAAARLLTELVAAHPELSSGGSRER